jgi:hypothetical protein
VTDRELPVGSRETPGDNVEPVQQLWIVCPSYKDVASFTMLRERILDVAHATGPVRDACIRFIVVDDTGGFDPEIAQLQCFNEIRVVTPPFNVGHQRAIVCGLRTILPDVRDSDIVVTMDADGEDRPEDLPRLLAAVADAPEDLKKLCVARRTKRQESVRFRVMYFFFRAMFRILAGTTIRSGNYAAYRGWLARRMLLHPYFDLCYSSSLVALDIEVTLVPCPRGKRYAGKSRMNLLRLCTHGVRMLMPFTDRIAVRALIAFTVTFTISILLSLAVVATRLFTTAAVPGWATATLLGVLLLSFLALGNFVVLFVVFSHSRGISLAGLEEGLDRSARGASASAD